MALCIRQNQQNCSPTQIMNLKVNYALQLIIMYQYFNTCSTSILTHVAHKSKLLIVETTRIQNEYLEISAFCTQFFYKPKNTLKIILIIKKHLKEIIQLCCIFILSLE